MSSKDGSAKCDVQVTDNPDQRVYGVVYRIAEAEKPGLDQAEGLGFGYEQKNILVGLQDGAVVQAFCYYATKINLQLKPLDWYKEHVLRGARENSLPEAYIRSIEAIDAIPDSNTARSERELSVYRWTEGGMAY